MEATSYLNESDIDFLRFFGSIMHISWSALINFMLGICLMITVKLSIVVYIFINFIYAIFYFKYVNLYSIFRHEGYLGDRTEFNYFDVQNL